MSKSVRRFAALLVAAVACTAAASVNASTSWPVGTAVPCAGLPFVGLAAQRGVALPGQSAQPNGAPRREAAGEEIAKLREMLRQPGPEARTQREAAVDTLLRMLEPAAHAVLQERLAEGDDPDGVTRLILRLLAVRFANSQDPVFGAASKDRARLQKAYVPSLVRFFADAPASSDGPPGTPPGGASDGPAAGDPLVAAARECLVALPTLERQDALRALLEAGDAAMQTAALRAAAETRDMNAARLLAGWLEHPVLGPTARAALQRLTFQSQPFASKEAFDQWLASNENKTYVQLAEEAARRSQQALHEQRLRAQEQLASVIGELIQSYLGRENIDWKRIRDRILVADPPGAGVAALRAVREVLAREERFGGAPADRLALLADLRKRLEQDGGSRVSTAERVLLLETSAYLVAPGDAKEMRQDVGRSLREALLVDDAAVRRAAISGLRRFPSADSRAAVAVAALRALDRRNLELLEASLHTLSARTWTAPSAGELGEQEWLNALRRAIQDRQLPDPLREQALKALILRDGQGKPRPEAFALLLDVTRDGDEKPVIREQAMVLLWGGFTGDEERADRVVRHMIELLGEPSERVRTKAAELLQALPSQKRGTLDDWTAVLVQKADERLVNETDEAAFLAFAKCLERRIDPDSGQVENVITRFCLAVAGLAKGDTEQAATRRAHLVRIMTAQAAAPGLKPLLWMRIGEELLKLGARRELREILTRQKPLAQAGSGDEAVLRALQLMVRTALLKPGEEPWTRDEVDDVLQAFGLLDKAKMAMAEPRPALLRAELLLERGDAAEALQQAERCRARPDVADAVELRSGALLVAARAQIALERLDDARATLQDVSHEGGPAAAVLAAQERLGLAFLHKGRARDAAELLRAVVRATPETAAAWRARFLSAIEAELAADQTLKDSVLQRLRSKRELFQASDTPDGLRARYEELERQLVN